MKWKALSIKSKANKGLFREIEAEELLSSSKNKEDFQIVKKLIQGDKSKAAEKKRSAALASVAGGGSGHGGAKRDSRLKKLLSQSDEGTDDSKKSSNRPAGWGKIKMQIVKNAQNFPSVNPITGPEMAEVAVAVKGWKITKTICMTLFHPKLC